MRALLKVAAWCYLLGWSALTYAHHSIAAYAVDESREVSGIVSEVRLVNPHAYFVLDVSDETGAVTSWRVETAAPAILRRGGWDATTVRVGDQVVATGAPLASGDPEMNLEFFFLADGTRITRTGNIGGPPADTAAAAGEGGPPAGAAAAGEGGSTLAAGGMGQPGGMAPAGGMGRQGGMGRGPGDVAFPAEPDPSGAPRELLTGVWSTNWGSPFTRSTDPQAREKMTAAGLARFEAFDINVENMANCRLVGAPRLARGTVYSHEVVDIGHTIYIISEYNAETRRIYMDGQEPHRYFAPNKLGWSNGEYEDGVLTITTRHLTEEYIEASSGNYFGGGEDAYMIEKIFVVEEGNELVYMTWFHDPAHYTEPYRTSQNWRRMDVDEGFLLDCEPTVYTLAE